MEKRRVGFAVYFVAGAALLLMNAAQAHAFAGMTPGKLLKELRWAIEKSPTTEVNWRNHLDPTFNSWRIGASHNLPVVAAGVGLFRAESVNMPGTNVSYVAWWTKFLAAQTGQLHAPDPAKLRYFHSGEPFSNTYDAPVVTTVVAVRYWAQRSGNAELVELARRYLRATWAVYALSAGDGPADLYHLDGRAPMPPGAVDPAPHTEYDPLSPIRTDGTHRFGGNFLALAGARSTLVHWVGDDRMPLFARAIERTPYRTNENADQTNVLVLVQSRWSQLASRPAENVYALTATDRSNISTLISSGSNAPTFMPWLAGIRTARTFRVLGWAGFRASIMEGNPNGINPSMYGVAYNSSNNVAYFLYPWTDRNGGGAEGWARLEPGVARASNYPGTDNHPPMEVSMTLPTTNPLFHLVLSQNDEPYFETSPTNEFPPRDPWVVDFPKNP